MRQFDDWFKELTSDTRWVELLRHYRDDTIKKAGEKVFAQLVADSTVEVRPMSENRKHVYNILIKSGPGDKPLPKPFKIQEEEKVEAQKAEDWKPADPAHVDKCVKEFFDMMKDAPMVRYKPPSREVFYNEPKEKLPPYPVTSLEIAYIKKRHFEYIKANFEARTGHKLPTWINEDDWNIQYDNEHL